MVCYPYPTLILEGECSCEENIWHLALSFGTYVAWLVFGLQDTTHKYILDFKTLHKYILDFKTPHTNTFWTSRHHTQIHFGLQDTTHKYILKLKKYFFLSQEKNKEQPKIDQLLRFGSSIQGGQNVRIVRIVRICFQIVRIVRIFILENPPFF